MMITQRTSYRERAFLKNTASFVQDASFILTETSEEGNFWQNFRAEDIFPGGLIPKYNHVWEKRNFVANEDVS